MSVEASELLPSLVLEAESDRRYLRGDGAASRVVVA